MKHLTIFLAICLATATVASQVPQKFSYQGLLKTTSCTFVADGNYDIQFDFYDALTMGILKHTETKNGVPVSKGTFNVVLGPMPLIFDEAIFVEITVLAGPDISVPQTFSPRYELTTAPYAFNAIHAMTANPVGPAGGDLTGTYPDPNIAPDAVTTGKILDGTILGGDIANSQVVRSLNKITDHIKLVGKDGAAITSNLDTIFIHAGGGGGGGVSAIQNTDGRLEVTDPTGPTATINISKTGASAGQALIYDGANVVWQTPGGGGGLTLPYEGSVEPAGGQAAFKVTSTTATGTGYGVYGQSNSTSGRGVYGWADASSGLTYGVYGQSNSTSGRGLYGLANASSGGNYGVYGKSNSPIGYGVQGVSQYIGTYGMATATIGTNYGVYGQSNSTSGYGVYGWADALSGTTAGVYGNSSSTSGYGVFGYAPKYGIEGRATNTTGIADGVRGVSLSTGGTGVFGWATALSGATAGVLGNSSSTFGSGVYGFASAASGSTRGVYGVSHSSSGVGLYGIATTSSGTTYGVYGESNSSSGRGVQGISPYLGTYGRADGTSGINYGLYGKSMSSSGYGVYGTAEATSGINYGVYGRSNSATGFGVYGYNATDDGIAIYGYAPIGYAGKFDGDVKILDDLYVYQNVYVSGTLSKGGGSFKIDHPLNPENKYLYHSFVESPDMMNIYNGNITLNDKGEAVVQLPEWFGALNKEFRYQLTAIGAPGPNLYIAQEVRNNSFAIAGGNSGMKISWQVTGIRKDAFAEKNRIPIEEDKKTEERGKYLHPEAFGLAKERGIEALHIPPESPMMKEAESEVIHEVHPPIPSEIDEPISSPPPPLDIRDADLPEVETPKVPDIR
ncbi:MAG: hypothetical protein Q8K98_12335 [Bacteroidota bacterium]|nr:hypothetical protein [Bacteroidota bacterium]